MLSNSNMFFASFPDDSIGSSFGYFTILAATGIGARLILSIVAGESLVKAGLYGAFILAGFFASSALLHLSARLLGGQGNFNQSALIIAYGSTPNLSIR